jgi:excisionase family DNA binding protein
MEAVEPKDVMLTYEEAAELLGLKIATLYAMVSQRRIPAYRYGNRMVRFSRNELLAWMADRSVPVATAS